MKAKFKNATPGTMTVLTREDSSTKAHGNITM